MFDPHSFVFLIIIFVLILCLAIQVNKNENETPIATYRLAGQRNLGDCSPADDDIIITMTPSTGLPETITVKDGETFLFEREFQTGDSFEIKQEGEITGVTCTITNPTGTFHTADIVNVLVSCSSDTKYTIGGTFDVDIDRTITAIINPSLPSEETITVNVLSGTGNFVFAETYPTGTVYEIQRLTDDWTVTNGTGIIQCANVTDADVVFVSPP